MASSQTRKFVRAAVVWLALGVGAVAAQAAGDGPGAPYIPGTLAATDLALVGGNVVMPPMEQGVEGDTPRNIEQVAGDPAFFTGLWQPRRGAMLSNPPVVWLHLRFLADGRPSTSGWVIEVPQPFVSQVEFYSRDAQGIWRKQEAGAHVDHNKWPLPALVPHFVMPPMAAGTHDVYLRMRSLLPLNFSLNLMRSDTVAVRARNGFMLLGFVGGVTFLIVGLSIFLALNYRMAAFAWYGVYGCMGAIAAASYLGWANYALWPHWLAWREQCILVVTMLALAAQLQFCRWMFLRDTSGRWDRVAQVCIAVALVFAITIPLVHIPVFAAVTYLTVALVLPIFMMAAVLRGINQRRLQSIIWLLAYAPLFGTIAITALVEFKVIPDFGMPYETPIYCLLFEMPMLLMSLHQYAKHKHADGVRQKVLEEVDPLTGFLDSREFPLTLHRFWVDARRDGSPLALAYVKVMIHQRDKLPTELADRVRARNVRLLRTVMRETDVVAHVKGNVFALLMPGLGLGDDLTSRMGRLVSLALMADTESPQFPPVRFKLAVTTADSFEGSPDAVDAALWDALDSAQDWGDKAIRFVNSRPTDAPARWLLDDPWSYEQEPDRAHLH